MQKTDIFQLYMKKFLSVDIIHFYFDLIADGSDTAVDKYFSFVGKIIDLFICMSMGVLSVGIL